MKTTNTRRIVPLAFLAALFLVGTPMLPVFEGPPDTSEVAIRPLYGPSGELPFLAGQHRPADAPAAPPLAPDHLPWSWVLFQSFRDDNWEIYRGNDDGTGQTRLTHNDSTVDIQPRLNRGGTRVVYSARQGGIYSLYAMNPDGLSVAQLTASGADDVNPSWSPDGGRIAFESYRDGQPEIYVMIADGSGQTRLTYDADYDGVPAWSPDGTRIAFVSRRTGGYRIYVMNADGSGQTPLSAQPYSNNPAWSPDGTRIAYDADGGGDSWQEIWLMNADGSDQHELFDPPTYQTDAWVRSWSPDGRYIAFTEITFIQYQGNWYWTHAYQKARDVMAATTISLSGSDLDWYPDWQTRDAEPPSSAVQPLPAESPSPFPVAWSGIDAGPAGLRSYDVQVRAGANGAWQDWLLDTTATSGSYSGSGGQTYYFRSRARDNAWNVEPWPAVPDAFTTVEGHPPQSAVVPLPAFFRHGSGLPVAWRGTDPGGSGIVSYDVQYRLSSGSWTDWQSGVTTTSAVFTGGSIGHTVYFRARARDAAQNLEPWPAGSGDTQTTFYIWAVSGNLTDNGGAPVVGAAATTAPPAMNTVPSDSAGDYATYLWTTSDQYGVTVAKSGYGALPATGFQDPYIGRFDATLPPADNVVADWGFESGSFTPAWIPGGEWPPGLTDTVRHTGQFAALLGQPEPGFGPIKALSNPNTPVYYLPQIASGPDGAVHVVWIENGLRYARRAADGTWSAVQVLDNAGTSYPQLVMGADGTLHAVWDAYEFLRYARLQGGVWSPVEPVATLQWPSNTRLAVDAYGQVHILWSDLIQGYSELYYRRRAANGTWTNPEIVPILSPGGVTDADMVVSPAGAAQVLCRHYYGSNGKLVFTERRSADDWTEPRAISDASVEPHHPALVIGPSGELVVLWLQYSGPDEGVYAARRDPQGNWYAALKVSEVAAFVARAAADGRVHVALNYIDRVAYLQRAADGGWLPETTLATGNGLGQGDLTLDSGGFPLVAWGVNEEWNTGEDIYYTQMLPDGTWRPVQNLANSSGDSYRPEVALDTGGAAHFIWLDETAGLPNVYYRGPDMAAAASSSILSQVITIPLTTTNPSISFLYQLNGPADWTDSELVVEVDDGGSVTPLLALNEATGSAWARGRADLSAWAGQSVTVIFRLQQAAAAPRAWAYLDEVAVGTTYPDLWVRGAAAFGLPGETVTYALTYGNRGAAAAAGVSLTNTLPAGLTFLSASVPPAVTGSTLVWDLGDVSAASGPFSIEVTVRIEPSVPAFTELASPAELGAAGPELETANNAATATIWVADLTYLPVAKRP